MKHNQILRRGLSILLSLVLCLSLLPATALAEGTESVTICGTTLEEGKAYVPSAGGGIAEKTEETAYLEYSSGTLTVHGNVTVALPSSSADNVLKLESGDLTINCPADSSLTLDGQNSAAAVSLQSSTLTLTGAGDVTIQGSETAVSGGTLKAESYSGDLAISAAGNSATVNNTVLNLDTTGNISITGSMPVAGGLLTVTNAADVTITGSVGNLLPDGSVITDTGSISIESESNMVVNGLTVNNAEKVTLTGDTTGPVAMSVTLNNCESWDIINKNQTSAAPLAINITVDGTPYGNCYGVTVTDDDNGTASASLPVASAGTNITLSATPDRGYRFKEWQVAPDTVTINDNQFTMPGANVTVQAVFESIPSVDVAIDEANFPDKTFREYVSDNFDENEDNVLSDDEIAKVTSIDCNGSGITNLKGIEHFTELQNLYCYENNLTTLDLSNNTKLESLSCGNNQLTKLDLSNNTKLESLSCYENNLTTLDLSNNTKLESLFCSDNQLTSLDLENTKLDFLLANDNSYEITLTDGIFDLTELESFGFDVSKATDWTGGTVEGNTLTVNSNAVRVTYKYDCGKNKTVTFTLRVKGGGGNGDGVPIDDKNFPDAVFRKYVSKFDTNNDDALNEAEIAVVNEIDVYGDSVQDLTGIAHFTALEELDCGENDLTTLDVSKNKALTYLDCGPNDLTTLDVSENKDLEELVCSGNDLTVLNLSNNTALKVLNCNDNKLTSLDLSKNTALEYLECSYNNLTSMDLSKNSALTTLSADNNTYAITLTGGTFNLDKLSKFGFKASKATDWTGGTVEGNTLTVNSDTVTYKYDCGNDKDFVTFTLLPGIAIDTTNFPDKTFRDYISDEFDDNSDGVLSDDEIAEANRITCNYREISNLKGIEHFTALTALNCSNNKLTNLDVSSNTALEYLNCSGNQLTELEVGSNTALTTLSCGGNPLTSLNVSKNTALTTLSCTNNSLTKLDVSDLTELTELTCSGNPLTSLDVSQNHKLETLYCSSCALTSLDLSGTNVTGLSAAYNSYDITLTDGTFDLDELSEFGFKASKATDWTGGTVDEDGILTLNSGETKVTYKYDCENGHSVIFTLDATPKYTVTVGGIYHSHFGNEPGETFTLDYAAGERVTLEIGKREGYTLKDLTLSGIDEEQLKWNAKDVETDQRAIGFTMPANDVTIRVNWKQTAATYTVTFDANGGSGTMTAQTTTGEYTLPECTFTAPSGKQFAGWATSADGEVITGTITVTEDTTLYAVWEDISDTTCDETADFTIGDGSAALALLNAAKTEGAADSEWDPATSTLTLKGVDFTTSAATAVKLPDGATIVLADGTENTIANVHGLIGSSVGIQSNGNITIHGSGTLTVTAGTAAQKSCGIYSPDGNVTIKGGTVTATGGETTEASWVSCGIYAYGVTISGGTVTATGGEATGEASESYGIWAYGDMDISGGTVNATGGNVDLYSYGIYAGGAVTISGGTVTATGGEVTDEASESFGIESHDSETIIISGGHVTARTLTTTAWTKSALNAAPDLSGYTGYQWRTSASGDFTSSADTAYTYRESDTYVEFSSQNTVTTYAITVDSAKNGDVTTSHKTASKGTTVTLTVEPDKGFELDTLTVTDGSGKKVSVTEKSGKYTFTMPASKVTVKATFAEIVAEPENPFVDVADDAYYFDAVLWAAENGITGGVDDTHFAPNVTCTRAQAVTFLWRAAGSPAPKSSEMPFEDVAAGSYYDAVLWAVENGITKGTSDTTFSPNADCTRAQAMAFIWRSQKSAAADGVNPFTDVAADAYYAGAVQWAVENGVTNGTSDTTFSPNTNCTRAHIVTFLYRCLGEE